MERPSFLHFFHFFLELPSGYDFLISVWGAFFAICFASRGDQKFNDFFHLRCLDFGEKMEPFLRKCSQGGSKIILKALLWLLPLLTSFSTGLDRFWFDFWTLLGRFWGNVSPFQWHFGSIPSSLRPFLHPSLHPFFPPSLHPFFASFLHPRISSSIVGFNLVGRSLAWQTARSD